ncbi:MAG: LysE family translocator [Halobacteriaceae archaeon]
MVDVAASLLSAAVGAALGLSLAAPPGPLNALIAGEAATRGWRAGVAAGLGAMTADACFFLATAAGLQPLLARAERLRAGLFVVGGLLLWLLAVSAYRDTSTGGDGKAGVERRGFGGAFALAITNPYQIGWWLTVGVGLLDPGAVQVFGHGLPAGGAVATVAGFFGGIALWVTVFPGAVRLAADRTTLLRDAVGYGSAAVLAAFGSLYLSAGLL